LKSVNTIAAATRNAIKAFNTNPSAITTRLQNRPRLLLGPRSHCYCCC
jgi:hypothetical protein